MERIQPSRAHLTEAKKVRKALLEDRTTYTESVGKIDLAHLAPNPDASKTGGAILRLILGATEKGMPFRALSYIDSALRSAQHLDIDQLQIIHANAVGGRINAIDTHKAHDAAAQLAEAANEIVAMHQERNFSILHAVDTPFDTKRYEILAERALDSNPAIGDKLKGRGAKHGGDALAYTAVHFAFQDTNRLELQPLFANAPAQADGERIISIGCQQEQTFYLARMAMRGLAGDKDDMIEETAQVFTKHVVPPYYFARGGEPTLQDGMDTEGLNFLSDDAVMRLNLIDDPAARRDIQHFITVNNQGGNE